MDAATAEKVVSILRTRGEELTKLAASAGSGAISKILDEHPEVKDKFAGGWDELKSLADKSGAPEAKKIVEDTTAQIVSIFKDGAFQFRGFIPSFRGLIPRCLFACSQASPSSPSPKHATSFNKRPKRSRSLLTRVRKKLTTRHLRYEVSILAFHHRMVRSLAANRLPSHTSRKSPNSSSLSTTTRPYWPHRAQAGVPLRSGAL